MGNKYFNLTFNICSKGFSIIFLIFQAICAEINDKTWNKIPRVCLDLDLHWFLILTLAQHRLKMLAALSVYLKDKFKTDMSSFFNTTTNILLLIHC